MATCRPIREKNEARCAFLTDIHLFICLSVSLCYIRYFVVRGWYAQCRSSIHSVRSQC